MNFGIVTSWGEQGAGIVSKQYYDLLKESFDVYVYVRGYQKALQIEEGYNCYVGSQKVESKPMAINKSDFKKWIDRNKIETILFNEQWWWPPLLWCKEWGIKTIAYVDYYTEQTIPLFEVYDMLICNTKKHFKIFSEHTNASYFKWGTQTDLYKPNDRQIDRVTFFHSCGFSPGRKGTDLLIKAFYNSKREGKLIIHSQVDLFEKIPELKKEIQILIEEKSLEIINKTVTAPGLYSLGDVYVYPSRLEGIGLTIAEAQSCGLFTIVSDEAPMNEFVLDTSNSIINIKKTYARSDGYYWPQVDVNIKDLTYKINTLAADKTLVNDLKYQSRVYAENHLSFNKNHSELISIIKDLKINTLTEELSDRIDTYELNRPLTHRKLVYYYNKYISKKLSFFRYLLLLMSKK